MARVQDAPDDLRPRAVEGRLPLFVVVVWLLVQVVVQVVQVVVVVVAAAHLWHHHQERDPMRPGRSESPPKNPLNAHLVEVGVAVHVELLAVVELQLVVAQVVMVVVVDVVVVVVVEVVVVEVGRRAARRTGPDGEAAPAAQRRLQLFGVAGTSKRHVGRHRNVDLSERAISPVDGGLVRRGQTGVAAALAALQVQVGVGQAHQTHQTGARLPADRRPFRSVKTQQQAATPFRINGNNYTNNRGGKDQLSWSSLTWFL